MKKRASQTKVEKQSQGSTGPERIKMMIIAAGDKAPASVRPYIAHVATVVAMLMTFWDLASPYCVMICGHAQTLYEVVPEDILYAFFGLMLCFFGGTFAATIAAIEAFRMTGWEQTRSNMLSLYEDFKTIKAAHDADEQKDDNNDGVRDVSQRSASELLARKVHVALVSIKEPEKINNALMGIASSCLSVVAVLRVEFAKTVTLAVSIGNSMRAIAEQFAVPVLNKVVPESYRHWVPTVINYVCKTIAIAFAWYIQKVISAFHSGIRGGLMFSRRLMDYANKQGYIKINHEESFIDEIVGWGLAAIGVWFQVRYGFTLPFPLNLLLLPVSILEWFIIWVVSDSSTTA
jgi:hypothetical protein